MAIVHVQHASANAGTVTFTSQPAAGNCLIACMQGYGGSSVGSVKLGSLTENWTALATVSGGGQVAAIWMDPGCGNGSSSVTFTSAGATQQNMQIYEFSGLGTSPSNDVTPATYLNTATTSSWSSGTTALTANAGDLWLGMFAGNSARTSYAATPPGSPWNCPAGQQGTTGGFDLSTDLVSGYRIPGVTGVVAFSGTQNTSIASWAAIAVALSPAGGVPASGGSGSFLSFF